MIWCPMCDYEAKNEIDRVTKGVKKKQLWGSMDIKRDLPKVGFAR